MKELKFNINYLFHKREFYFVIFIVFFINLVHVFLSISEVLRTNLIYESISTAEYQSILYNSCDLNSILIIVFPILFSMIFSDASFMEDKRKTTNMLATRLNLKKNIIVRMFLSMFVTFLICFLGFLFNYIVLIIIFKSGNIVTSFQESAFNMLSYPSFFLDGLRLNNPVLFTLICNLLVSLMYGILSMFSYVVSLCIKNRIIIYFISVCYLIIIELLFPLLNWSKLSYINCFQISALSDFSPFIVNTILIIILSVIILIYYFKKKDVLL